MVNSDEASSAFYNGSILTYCDVVSLTYEGVTVRATDRMTWEFFSKQRLRLRDMGEEGRVRPVYVLRC
jgi:hypothetical protein